MIVNNVSIKEISFLIFFENVLNSIPAFLRELLPASLYVKKGCLGEKKSAQGIISLIFSRHIIINSRSHGYLGYVTLEFCVIIITDDFVLLVILINL